MNPNLLILPLMLFSLSLPVVADSTKIAATTDIVTQPSPYPVAETMDRFETIVKKKGLDVFARINHRQNAKDVGLDMNEAQVLIFGNPKAGTALMKQDVAVALDLPMRVAVYEDKAGKVQIAYHTPSSLAASYALPDSPVLPNLAEALGKLTAAAVAKP